MHDQILSGYLQDFSEQHGVEKLSPQELSSRFVTYCVVSKQAGGKPRPHGNAAYWNIEREFGFVKMDDGTDVFVHSTAIRETIHKYLRVGDKVEFDNVQTDRGPQARDLRILPRS